MSRYAILSDIHANLEALEAVLSHAGKKKVDEIWFLGDLIVYGPNPNKCVARLREAIGAEGWPGTAVLGNNDYAIIEGKDPQTISDMLVMGGEISEENKAYKDATVECHKWTEERLTDENKELLKEIEHGPRHVLASVILVHASPCDALGEEGNYLTNLMEAEEAFYCLEDRLCLFGHTHLATLFRETRTDRPYRNCEVWRKDSLTGRRISLAGGRLLLNPGSVGQPRDGDSRAAYAILDNSEETMEFYRVEYDRKKTLQKLHDAGLSPKTAGILQDRLRTAK